MLSKEQIEIQNEKYEHLEKEKKEIEETFQKALSSLSGKNTNSIINTLERFLKQVTLQSTLQDDCQFL